MKSESNFMIKKQSKTIQNRNKNHFIKLEHVVKLQYNQLAQGTRKICVLSNTYNTEAIEKNKKNIRKDRNIKRNDKFE